MADYPDDIPTFREILNLPNEPYDSNKKTTIYAEDFDTIRAEVIAITQTLGVLLENIYPVGSIVVFGDGTTSPETRGMLGTWERHCTGRAHVSLEETGVFDTVGMEIGEDEVTLTEGQLPEVTVTQNAHTHTQNAHNHTQASHSHAIATYFTGAGNGVYISAAAGSIVNGSASGVGSATPTINNTTATNNDTTATNQPFGNDEAHNNIQRSKVVVCWIRTI